MNDPMGVACDAMAPILVDYVDGALAPRQAARVEQHCSACPECAGALDALRELPGKLLEQPASPVSWEAQRQRIMARVDEIGRAESTRREGFDLRVVLPLAAAALIALAGVVSLQSVGRDVPGSKPARAALLFAMEDPETRGELSEALGEPLLLAEPVTIEDSDPLVVRSWLSDELVGEIGAPLSDLDDVETAELEQILGIEMSV